MKNIFWNLEHGGIHKKRYMKKIEGFLNERN